MLSNLNFRTRWWISKFSAARLALEHFDSGFTVESGLKVRVTMQRKHQGGGMGVKPGRVPVREDGGGSLRRNLVGAGAEAERKPACCSGSLLGQLGG